MSTRKANWTREEDRVLTETVQRFMSEGNTQLAAFEEAARRIQRSASACAFRWNSKLRKEIGPNAEGNRFRFFGREQEPAAPEDAARSHGDLVPLPELLDNLKAYDRLIRELKQTVIERDQEIARLKDQLRLNIPPEELKKLLDILQSKAAVS